MLYRPHNWHRRASYPTRNAFLTLKENLTYVTVGIGVLRFFGSAYVSLLNPIARIL